MKREQKIDILKSALKLQNKYFVNQNKYSDIINFDSVFDYHRDFDSIIESAIGDHIKFGEDHHANYTGVMCYCRLPDNVLFALAKYLVDYGILTDEERLDFCNTIYSEFGAHAELKGDDSCQE